MKNIHLIIKCFLIIFEYFFFYSTTALNKQLSFHSQSVL